MKIQFMDLDALLASGFRKIGIDKKLKNNNYMMEQNRIAIKFMVKNYV